MSENIEECQNVSEYWRCVTRISEKGSKCRTSEMESDGRYNNLERMLWRMLKYYDFTFQTLGLSLRLSTVFLLTVLHTSTSFFTADGFIDDINKFLQLLLNLCMLRRTLTTPNVANDQMPLLPIKKLTEVNSIGQVS